MVVDLPAVVFNNRWRFRRFCMMASCAHGQNESSSSLDILNLFRVASKWKKISLQVPLSCLSAASTMENAYLLRRLNLRCERHVRFQLVPNLDDRTQHRPAWEYNHWYSNDCLESSSHLHVVRLHFQWFKAISKYTWASSTYTWSLTRTDSYSPLASSLTASSWSWESGSFSDTKT